MSSFVHPVPSITALETFYDQFHLSAEDGGWYDDMEIRMAIDFPAKVEVLARLAGNSGRVLDVGCGKGGFVRACRDRGLQAEGVDISRSAIAYARDVVGVPARVCDLSEESVDRKYSCISFWATIEHLPNPNRMLKGIRKAMSANGYLVLDTGIGHDWLDRLLPGVVQWYDPPQHLFVFSRLGIIQLLEKNGFKVVSIDTCFERNFARRIVKIARGALAGVALRTVARATSIRSIPPYFTRYPLGNLMQIVAQRTPDDEFDDCE